MNDGPDAQNTSHRPEGGHVQGVEATAGGLVRATLGSAAAAGAILVFAWLPAEYGIDPTGVGTLLGLTEMGEIKQQLSAEAAAEDTAMATQAPAAPGRAANSGLEVAERPASTENQVPPSAAEPPASVWRDEVSYTLAVGEGIEVKLAMAKGAVAEFEWTANGAVLNHDTHGAGSGQRISYERGRGVPGEQGELVAAFDGRHGWFWRNRTDAPVTFTLRTRGEYQEIIAP